jgi:CRISPR/Cas system-associated endonuclease Cas3-HD
MWAEWLEEAFLRAFALIVNRHGQTEGKEHRQMHVQINTDSNIEGINELTQHVEAVVRGAVDHLNERITRVDVYLSDQNSDKKTGYNAIRCLLEASLVGLQPIVVSDQAETVEQAVEGAAEKLKHSLESTLGRLGEH